MYTNRSLQTGRRGPFIYDKNMKKIFSNPVVHGVAAFLVLAVPFLVLHFPQYADLTLGSVAAGMTSWISSKLS